MFIIHNQEKNGVIELLTYYVIGGALLIGAPAVFFVIAFMPALMNTKGRMVGYKEHKEYGDISSYENSVTNQGTFYLRVIDKSTTTLRQ